MVAIQGIHQVIKKYNFETKIWEKVTDLIWITKWKIDQALWDDYVVSYIVIEIDEKTRKCIWVEKQRLIWRF
jgi:hypothetical protein